MLLQAVAVDAVRLWHMSLAAAAMGDLCAHTAAAVAHRVQAHVRRLYDCVNRLNTARNKKRTPPPIGSHMRARCRVRSIPVTRVIATCV